MEKNTDFVLSQDYKDSINEIDKLLKLSFGFHFLCLSDVDYSFENYVTPRLKSHSCINTYAHSCLKPLSNQTKAMFKSWNSRAV